MRFADRAVLVAVMATCLGVSGCASNMGERDARSVGRPDIIYLQPANLSAGESSGGVGYAVLYLIAGPLIVAGSAVGVLQKEQYQRDAIASNERVIKSLGFDDRVRNVFADAVGDASWLPVRDIKTVPGTESVDDYTRNSSADSVIYLKPTFSLTSYGRVFVVDVEVGAQKYIRNGQYSRFQTLYAQTFTFKHDLVVKKSGLTWDEQVNLGHELAQLSPEDATRLWLENDGERLRADFAEDLPQIEAGVRRFFGDAQRTPGG